ncbi:MAG TPA: cytochrome c [Bryobacteraceae bacterium]|nr:cytochrome c [Bryobacteraceae bacterium]
MRIRAAWFLATLTGLAVVVLAHPQAPDNTNVPQGYVVDGPSLYKTYCASCHGIAGKGDGPAAPALKKAPPDLTAISQRNKGQFPDFRIARIIDGTAEARDLITAHGSREMPVWGDLLPQNRDEGLLKLREHNLTEYLRSMQK